MGTAIITRRVTSQQGIPVIEASIATGTYSYHFDFLDGVHYQGDDGKQYGIDLTSHGDYATTGLTDVAAGTTSITVNSLDYVGAVNWYNDGYFVSSYGPGGQGVWQNGMYTSTTIPVHPGANQFIISIYKPGSSQFWRNTATTFANWVNNLQVTYTTTPSSYESGTYTLNNVLYQYHIFKANGTLNISQISPDANLNKIEYLVIGGGGGGGQEYAGGGGAGGYRSSVVGELSGRNSSAETPITPTIGTFPVVVGYGGRGGAGGTYVNVSTGYNGGNSSIFGITSLGGGGGGAATGNNNTGDTTYGLSTDRGLPGGSGGGSGIDWTIGGAGTAGQGFDGAGGVRGGSVQNPLSGGGGGGASASGTIAVASVSAGNGGSGIASSITGTSIARAAGGGGGAPTFRPQVAKGAGGTGGGGNGSDSIGFETRGVRFTGSGGGGSSNRGIATGTGRQEALKGHGGTGVVIVRYPIA